MFNYYLHLALQKNTLKRSFRVSIIVGIILTLINHPELFHFSASTLGFGTEALTFLVPFLVSTYSSILSNRTLKPGTVSNVDALLKCKNCNKTNFHIHVGQEVDECPQCKSKTKWNPLKIFSVADNESELLKSLALFARYNPMPLFRTTETGVILGANPASEHLFSDQDVVKKNIKDLIPGIKEIDFDKLISENNFQEIVIEISGRHFNLVVRGVTALKSVHIYGNDITEIVSAQQQIRKQANEIRQSIQYAWRIQQAMLPANEIIDELFPDHFIFYRPRNTVSGDFYWANRIGKHKIIAVADCTGHGVPGAFMSMMGISLLNEIISREQMTDPAEILNVLRERLILALKNKGEDMYVSDGMDISLISIDSETNLLRFAGAYNPLYLVRKSELIILEADRMPIGHFVKETGPFNRKEIQLEKNDNLYLFTDGYRDQTGGEKGKKYTSRQFKELVKELSEFPANVREEMIEATFDSWKQEHRQVDDVLVMGLQIV